MPRRSTSIHVFDFDGTLVETAGLKRQAFFDIFPEECHPVVDAVLREDPDGSRHLVIPQMIQRAGRDDLNPAEMVSAYGARVAELVPGAPPVEGAEAALRWAGEQGGAYVFSMTPETELRAELERRGLAPLLSGIFGHPKPKPEVLARLLRDHGAEPGDMVVVGDGVSDREAARSVGCAFVHASAGWPAKLMEDERGD